MVTTHAAVMARNGNGGGNGNGNGNGNGRVDDHVDVGLSVPEVMELIQRRVDDRNGKFEHIYTKVGNKLRKVPLDDILYIEVEGKYSALQVRDRKYNVKASLKDLLQKLPTNHFVRVSRNFVVNLNRIQHIDTFQYTVKVGGDGDSNQPNLQRGVDEAHQPHLTKAKASRFNKRCSRGAGK